MLHKFRSPQGDYLASLRRRRAYALAMLAVGLLGISCYFLLLPHSGLSDYARGFYCGAAWGTACAAAALLVRTQRLLHDPDTRKKAKIRETDERAQHLTAEAAQFAGVFTVFCGIAALFVVLPLSFHAYLALLSAIILYVLAFLAARLWLSKRV